MHRLHDNALGVVFVDFSNYINSEYLCASCECLKIQGLFLRSLWAFSTCKCRNHLVWEDIASHMALHHTNQFAIASHHACSEKVLLMSRALILILPLKGLINLMNQSLEFYSQETSHGQAGFNRIETLFDTPHVVSGLLTIMGYPTVLWKLPLI